MKPNPPAPRLTVEDLYRYRNRVVEEVEFLLPPYSDLEPTTRRTRLRQMLMDGPTFIRRSALIEILDIAINVRRPR